MGRLCRTQRQKVYGVGWQGLGNRMAENVICVTDPAFELTGTLQNPGIPATNWLGFPNHFACGIDRTGRLLRMVCLLLVFGSPSTLIVTAMKKVMFLLSFSFCVLNCQKEQVDVLDPLCAEEESVTGAPTLIDPPCRATLENGCSGFTRPTIWRFDWEDFPGASRYHIFVMHRGSRSSLVDEEVLVSEFAYDINGYIADHNLKYWFWKVRAFVDRKPTNSFSTI